MKIGILGAGHIGGTLGEKWVQAGHSVLFGVRNPSEQELLTRLRSLGTNACAGSPAEAIKFGDVVVFAIPGAAMDDMIRTHAQALQGKIIIDAAIKMGQPVMNSAQTFATLVPNAQVFRAFNSLGWENFQDPQFDGVPADLFYCGSEGQAQIMVEQLIVDVGLRPVRLGGMEQVDLVDAVTGVWFALAIGQKMGRRLAFKVLVP